MGRKVPIWCFPSRHFTCGSRKEDSKKKLGKRQINQNRVVTGNMRGILRNGNIPINYEDGPTRCVRKILSFGEAMQKENDSPNRLEYMLALRKRMTRAFVAKLARNRLQRRADRAACSANGLHVDESGNVYPFMTNMRTFINSAQNAVLMEGYTAARDVRFKAQGIVIAPRSGLRRAIRRAAAALAALDLGEV